MLFSYYKGGLITENNVFVFSSSALVTQCCVCANLQQLFKPSTEESHQVPAIDRIACNSGTPGLYWSTAKGGVKEKVEWSFKQSPSHLHSAASAQVCLRLRF